MRLVKLRRLSIISSFILMFPNNGVSQISITNQTAQDLIQNVLVGTGVEVSNVTFTGSALQIGSFSNGASTNLGISAGIVLTTGTASQNVAGPNMDDATTTSPEPNISNDPDLNQILSSLGTTPETNNLCIIEFDFIPSGDSVRFNYVFGSEEYNEWVCSDFFDAFGFFLSGPGITGAYSNNSKNLAIVPGTSLPVGINTVNNGSPGENAIFGSNCPFGGLSNSQYYLNNQFGTTLEMDGFTTVFTALSKVQCGETYHIKLVIANGGDVNYDSWVFLEAQSLSSNVIGIQFAGLLPDSSIVEGCVQGSITFVRSQTSEEETIPLAFSGTAQPGVDYTTLPSFITFPTGQDTVVINLDALADQIEEGSESLIVSFRVINECGDTLVVSSSLKIKDPYKLSIAPNDPVLTCPQPFYLFAPAVTGGFPPYTYLWDYNAQTTNSLVVPITASDTFIVVVKDLSNCFVVEATDTIVVTLNYDSLQTVGGRLELCDKASVTIGASAFSGLGPYSYNWAGFGQTDSITVSPTDTTFYKYEVTDACNVTAIDSFLVTVSQFDSLLVTTNDTTVCKDQDVLLKAIVNGGAGNYAYQWSGLGTITSINDSVSSVKPASTSGYVINVVDVCGVISTDTMLVTVEKCELKVGNAFSPNGDGTNDFFEIQNIQYYPNNTVSIYNRWGKKLFEQSGYTNAWDGDSDFISGTYFYILDPGDGSASLKGYFYVFKD
jgi:gliding motility-associated-like protein